MLTSDSEEREFYSPALGNITRNGEDTDNVPCVVSKRTSCFEKCHGRPIDYPCVFSLDGFALQHAGVQFSIERRAFLTEEVLVSHSDNLGGRDAE